MQIDDTDDHVERLLGEMTLREKAAQPAGTYVGTSGTDSLRYLGTTHGFRSEEIRAL